jgi:hypothetical protein
LLKHQASLRQTVTSSSDTVCGSVNKAFAFIWHEDQIVVRGMSWTEHVARSMDKLRQLLAHFLAGLV